MTFYKVGLFLVVVGMTSAEFGHDFHSGADYKFEYSVHDPHTHDVKSQAESRHGDVVKGFYTLKEADGTTREVHYTADEKNGFQADVQRSGHAAHPQHYTQPQHYDETQHYVQPQHFQAAPVHHFPQGLGHAFSSNNNNLFSHHF